ncbi:rho GTPase-activating protein 17-like [Scyliorhinus torazame]|uniref:rho GTPase-activating protein 17-like n=1 Tax=Scyliorhinus torazame TaxID=75743 RepID=UPI003B5B0D56
MLLPVVVKITIALTFYTSASFQAEASDIVTTSQFAMHPCIKEITEEQEMHCLLPIRVKQLAIKEIESSLQIQCKVGHDTTAIHKPWIMHHYHPPEVVSGTVVHNQEGVVLNIDAGPHEASRHEIKRGTKKRLKALDTAQTMDHDKITAVVLKTDRAMPPPKLFQYSCKNSIHLAMWKIVQHYKAVLRKNTEKSEHLTPVSLHWEVLKPALVQKVSEHYPEECQQKLLETCTEAENKLAFELASYESQIERDILDPFSNLAEMEIPNIQKQRKQLAKLVLDWDSAKMRYNQAHKAAFSGANFPAVAAKIDSLREEMDEAGNKVELCKDQLAADMYNFISKEGDYARYFVTLLEAQADYHRKSLAVLERVLPTIQTQQDTWTEKPAFGTALEEHLKRSGREIALPIEACVMMLLETGMKEEGLFRIAAGASKLKKLKAALDCSTAQLEEFYSDQHAVAGALKSYLRELPEPLMTFQLYDEWVQAASVPESDKKLQALWVTCSKMPKSNSSNFRYLIKFLSKLAQNSEINKMTPSNIAIVLGPNLLWAKNEGTLADMAAATSVHVVTIIEPIIQHADWFFPDDLDFNVSGMFTPMTPANHLNNLSFIGGDYDSSTLERKRPVSVGVVEDLLKKDSLGVKVNEPQLNPRRAGTLTRKHTCPTVQPPPPPIEAVHINEQQPSGFGPDSYPAAAAPSTATNVTEPQPQETDEYR